MTCGTQITSSILVSRYDVQARCFVCTLALSEPASKAGGDTEVMHDFIAILL